MNMSNTPAPLRGMLPQLVAVQPSDGRLSDLDSVSPMAILQILHAYPNMNSLKTAKGK